MLCPGYDIKLHLMIFEFEECEYLFITIALKSTLTWSGIVPVRVPSIGQIELFNRLMEIIISYLKPYTSEQVICIR